MLRIHVTGCHRSGTTLIFELLKACYEHDAHCEHEYSIFNPPEVNQADLYLTKKPSDITHIKRIFLADDDLFLIFMRRDPRDVITSIHPSRNNEYFSSFERWHRYQLAAEELNGHPRFLEIQYENLLTDPPGIQARIEDRLPWLNRLRSFSDYHQEATVTEAAAVSLGGVRPLDPSTIGHWGEHLPRIKFQLLQYPGLQDALLRYGYETSSAWADCLEDISPLSQAYGESRPGLLKRWETALRYRLKSHRYLQSVKR